MSRLIGLACFAVVAASLMAAVVTAFLPFVPTQWWLVRLLDFPRLPFAIATLALLALLPLVARGRPRATLFLGVAGLAAVGADAAVLWPYRAYGPAPLLAAKDCPVERRLSVMISNLLLTNRRSEGLLAEIRAEQPDLFLAMEVDDWWDRTLAPVAAEMPYGAKRITGSYYGIRLFSRLPLTGTEVRVLAGQDTPAIVTDVQMRDGTRATFLGMHPRPPLVGQSALPRDAQLYAAARLLRERDGPAILAGDLNATPWEDAVSRLRRIAGLVSPRQGRGYVYTFDATSWWMKWPLDQIDYRPGFTPVSVERLAPFGSDHYPYLVRLCRDAGAPPPAAPPPVSTDDRDRMAEADRAVGAGP